jgi:tetratricopeptide (TPR) repeat protein
MSPMTSNPKRVADTALSVGRAIKRLVVGKNFYEELRDRMTRLGHEAAKKHDRGDLEGALAGYRTTLELAQHISRTFGEWIGGWHNLRWAFWNVAWTEFALGHFDAAHEAQAEAVAFARKSLVGEGSGADDVDELAQALALMADIEDARGQTDAALAANTEAVAVSRRLVGLHGRKPEYLRRLAWSLLWLGKALGKRRDFAAATAALEEAVACSREAVALAPGDADSLDESVRCLFALGDVQRNSGAPAWAAINFECAAEVGRSLAELTYDSVAALEAWWVALDDLGDAWYDCLEYEKALRAYRHAVEIARRRVEVGGESRDALVCLGGSLFNAAHAAAACEDVPADEVVSAFRECVDAQRRVVALSGPATLPRVTLGYRLRRLAEAELKAEHLDAAARALEESLALLRSVPAGDEESAFARVEAARSMVTQAALKEALGEATAALNCCRDAIVESLRVIERNPNDKDAVESAGEAYLKLSEFEFEARQVDAARESRQAAIAHFRRLAAEVGDDRVRLGYPLELLDKVGDALMSGGALQDALVVRRAVADVYRGIVERDPGNAEPIEWLASALRQLILGLEAAGNADEARARRDELAAVEAKLHGVPIRDRADEPKLAEAVPVPG